MSVQRDFPIAPEPLWELLTDPDFLVARGERFGANNAPVVEDTDDGVRVTTFRAIPLDKVPAVAKPFVGTGIVEQADIWTHVDATDCQGRWSATVEGAPMRLSGAHHIVANETGSQYDITTDVKVDVPLFGARMAGEISNYLDDLITREMSFAADWIAEHA